MRLFRLALAVTVLVATTACSDASITFPDGPNNPACPGVPAGSGC